MMINEGAVVFPGVADPATGVGPGVREFCPKSINSIISQASFCDLCTMPMAFSHFDHLAGTQLSDP